MLELELQLGEWPHMGARKITVILCSLILCISLVAIMVNCEFTGSSSAQTGGSLATQDS